MQIASAFGLILNYLPQPQSILPLGISWHPYGAYGGQAAEAANDSVKSAAKSAFFMVITP